MRLTIVNRQEFQQQVAAFANKVRAQAEVRIMNIMYDAQEFATRHSPVYSGDFASNWNVSYGRPDTTFILAGGDYMRIDKDTLRAFSPNSALSVGKGNFDMSGFRLGQPVFLTNAAEHDEPYAWLIEDDKIKFREVNVGLGGVGRKTATHIIERFGV